MQPAKMHHIQKYILKTLCYCKWARFRDMRPKNVDTNLYNYHLKLLIKTGAIEKVEGKGYRLSPDGLRYVDYVSVTNFEPRWRPKLTTSIVAFNRDDILLWTKHKQPFIGRWTIPNGKMHYDDAHAEAAVRREMTYISNTEPANVRQKGVVEYRIFIAGVVVAHIITHVFTATLTEVNHAHAQYVALKDLPKLALVPGTQETIEAVLTERSFFLQKF
jgi:ADP-ribose pyrophosphatase YjhB (NUDIX family)